MIELKDRLLTGGHTWQEREHIKACLIRIGDETLLPVLEQALVDTNVVQLHLQIVEILASLAPSTKLQVILIECLHHISPPVRRRAMAALGHIGTQEAIFYLDQIALQKETGGVALDNEDIRLALEAINDIERRAKQGYRLA